ncbi:DNA-processing protein DprA [Pseudonocardia endophytica]|nr:DNA-processing protein DprA [Pseudonocardia endophytica]
MSARWDDDERAALVALLRTRPHGMTWSQIAADVDVRSSALALWEELHPADLFDTGAEQVELVAARRDIAAWRAAGLGFRTFLDDDYPAQLREVHDLPPVLFHRGTLVGSETAVSVVGSRKASPRGRELARSLASALVETGMTVLSGLAAGIDAAAHTAALEAGGRTVAVIGTGITRYYPAENRALQDRIAESGLLLSQFWPDAPPTKQTFPMRNAVMSGFGRATIVVEAGEQSGARIQARRAVEHGRTVVLTDAVVEANEWARVMVDRPGVYVASAPAEIIGIIEQTLAGPDELLSLLRSPAGR